jgi:D-proline reductase (dithiol) PrdB
MARMIDFTEQRRAQLEALDCPTFDDQPWVEGPALSQRRVTLVSTAGLMTRGERPFLGGDRRYREIPQSLPANDLMISHVSASFDRTGFQRDPEVVLPREGLAALAAEGIIGGVAEVHYSFMGATDPAQMERYAERLAGVLHERGVDSALLLPV